MLARLIDDHLHLHLVPVLVIDVYVHQLPLRPLLRQLKDRRYVHALQVLEVVAKLEEIGEKYNASIAQVALAWVLAKPFVSSIIIGATKMDQLEDNLGAADLSLAAEDIRTLDTITTPAVPYPTWMQGMGWDAKVQEALAGD